MQPQYQQPATDTATAPQPHVVPHPPEPVRPPRRWPYVLIVLLIAGAAGWWLMARRSAAERTSPVAAAAIRTAPVTFGSVEAVLRVTGVTAAQNYSSMMSPQMRGSRSNFGRDGSNSLSSQMVAATVTSNASQSNASSSGSSSSAGSSNLSAALRASTSRVSSGGSGSSSSSSAASSAASASNSMGASGLGSTSAELGAGSGGGGGGGDFSLVLEKMTPPGTRVSKGQVVAEFDRQYMLLRLDDYRASVTQAEADLRKLKTNLDVTRKAHDLTIAKAKATLDKANLDMKTLPVLSNMDVARVKLSVEEAQAKYKQTVEESRLVEASIASQIRNAEIEVEQTRIELRRVTANTDRMLVKTPIDGIAVAQNLYRGGEMAQIRAGDQLWPGMTFMTVVDPSSMVVDAVVNQSDVERLRIGAKATVHFDAYPDLKLPARVYSVGGIARQGGQRASYVKEIPIRLKLEQLDPRVIPDLSVAADVIVETAGEKAAVVPLAAVFQDSPGRPFVFVRDAAAGWKRRDVELGLASYIQAVVRGGLKAGEVVALERPPQKAPM